MHPRKLKYGFVFVSVIALTFAVSVQTKGQLLVANIFSMPLGYANNYTYAPRIIIQDGITYQDTSYGIKNPGLGNKITCFGIEWNQIYHAGVDLYQVDAFPEDNTTAGDEVVAVANGEVVFAGYENYPGYVIIIKHDDPFDDSANSKPIYSVYGHLETVSVISGGSVIRGETIGTVMPQTLNDGTDDSHLHFEIRYFEDGSNIYTNYPNCNGTTQQTGKGYTYPEHPDDFPIPEWGYTDPLAFIRSRNGVFLPEIHVDLPPTNTPTPILRPTLTATPTPSPTATPTPIPCIAGIDLVQNGDFEDPTQHDRWISDTENLINPYPDSPDEYALVMGYENSADQTVYQTITVPPEVDSVDIKFWLYVRTLEIAPVDSDYLYIDVVQGNGVSGASLLDEPFEPYTNQSSPGEWQKQTLHVVDIESIPVPIHLNFHATTNWALATAFYIDNVQLITGCE